MLVGSILNQGRTFQSTTIFIRRFQSEIIINLMQASIHNRVVLADVQKTIDLKVLTQYLTITKVIDSIIKFSKSNNKFFIEFKSQQEAKAFILDRAFKDQIMKRKMNLYFSVLEDQDIDVERYTINGLEQETLRKCFEICWTYGSCRLDIKEESDKKNIKGILQFEKTNTKKEVKKQQLTSQLKKIGVTLGQIEQNDNQFMCSIQLTNWDTVSNDINAEEINRLQQSLKTFMGKISEKKMRSYEVKDFVNKQSIPMAKAYLRYDTAEDTFGVFQKLRTYLLDLPPTITCRLFYFSKQANSFRTLFTTGLYIPQDTTEKQFQNKLIESLRKITPNVMQVLLKQCRGRIWTGKIYLKDEESGKILASEYFQKRGLIYKHYKDQGKITINLFQDKQAMNQIRKCEDNTERMLQHIRSTQERQRQMAPVMIRQNYPQRLPPPKQHLKYKEREEERPERNEKKEVKTRYKPKEEDFPSI